MIYVDYKTFIEEKQQNGENLIPVQDFSIIFKNFPQMIDYHENLLHTFEDRIKNWDTKKKIADAFVINKAPLQKLFTAYITEFQEMSEHFSNCSKNHPKFKKASEEFQKSPKCKSLRILDYLLQPIQRLPRYRLLLQEYQKNQPEGTEDYKDTAEALKIVLEAASHANDAMKDGV